MNNDADCERVRLALMAAFDGETQNDEPDAGPAAREHLRSCAACAEWMTVLESTGHRLQQASYPNAPADLWPAIERTLDRSAAKQLNRQRIFVLAALVLGWRALQLFVDLPLPLLQSLIPLAIGIAALWQLTRDPLAIQTFAPELQKRGA